MFGRAIRLRECRTFSGIFFARPFRLAMSFKRRIHCLFLVGLCFFGVIGCLSRLFLASLLTYKSLLRGRLFTGSALCLARFPFLTRIGGDSESAYFSHASNASTTIHVTFHVVQRTMVSSINWIICVRSTYDCIYDSWCLCVTWARFLRGNIALYLERFSVR